MVSEVRRRSCSHNDTNSSSAGCSHFDDVGCYRYFRNVKLSNACVAIRCHFLRVVGEKEG